MSRIILYKLEKKENDDFLCTLKEGRSAFKWLLFSDDKKHFLTQAGILSSLSYKRFLFKFIKNEETKDSYLFYIQDKEKKKLFSKTNKVILSGCIEGCEKDIKLLFDLLQERDALSYSGKEV